MTLESITFCCHILWEKLVKVNEQMGRPDLKLIQEVDTRWNSTYHMLQRIYDLRESVGAALAGLRTDIVPLSSENYEIMAECLKVLSPFHEATVELSEEKRVSGSKVIPLLRCFTMHWRRRILESYKLQRAES